VIQRFLRQVLIVQVQIPVQGLRQVLAAEEALAPQQFGDAPVEALHHAVGLWPARRDQSVLDVVQSHTADETRDVLWAVALRWHRNGP